MKKYLYSRCDSRTIAAFTLIELLVVIAIIAILSAILIPVISSTRIRSAAAVSQSNMRQLGVLFQQHVNTHTFYLPIGAYKSPDTGERETWDSSLSAYFDNEDEIAGILYAPADTLERKWDNQDPRTYSMVRGPNGIGGTGLVSYSTRPSEVSVLNVDKPSETLLLVEYLNSTNVVFGDSCAGAKAVSDQLTEGADMYGGKFNYLYVDGHVEFLEPEETIGTGTLDTPGGAWTIDTTD
jgi:prepilin-type N-terminal cleavage/methylation domain-containing protein/prepilin-type processing-associated H-X9-DG protein